MESEVIEKMELVLGDYRVKSVTVYQDRAEVTREISLPLTAGKKEVVLTKLSQYLDKESLRVDGTGHASILEVSFQEINVTAEQDEQGTENPEVTQLIKEKSDAKDRLAELEAEVLRVEQQRTMTELFTQTMVGAYKPSTSEQLVEVLQEQNLDNMLGFVDRYGEEMLSISEKLKDIEDEKKRINKRIPEIDKKLEDLGQAARDKPKQQVVGILLEISKDSNVTLLFSYRVSNAQWTPKYDLRVASEEKNMEIGYFGLIQQNTGEDWKSTHLTLSTATPSVGGTVPELDTCKLTFDSMGYGGESLFAKKSGGMSLRRRSSFRRRKKRKAFRPPSATDSLSSLSCESAEGSEEEFAATTISQALSSTTFEIAGEATIPSDNALHKVSVGTANLEPKFEYVTVPKMTPYAFLKATVRNTSQFVFLPGHANVYLDGTFVTDTTLGNISAGEEFSASLGVDQRIKVTYRPLERFREQSGILSKTTTYTFKQVTLLKNTTAESIVVTLTDQLPRSQEEKLKVTLMAPVLVKKQRGGPPPNPRLNSDHNIVWKMEMKPSAELPVTIQYQVEYPSGETIEGLGQL